MSVLLIEKNGTSARAALMIRNRLYAYQDELSVGALREEQILLGTVDRHIKGISGVFVRLPGKEYGFLPFAENEPSIPSGTRLILQIKRPPNHGKRALLSREIALPGSHVIYLPLSRGVRASNRCEAEDKARLRALGKGLKAEGGMIVRSSALHATAEELQAELDRLTERWQDIRARASAKTEPCLLWDGEDFIAKTLREEAERLEYVLTNDVSAVPADCAPPVRHSEHPFTLFNVEHKLETSLRRTVRLKSGATLIVDFCEAMTVIDVNSAMAPGGKSIGETAVKVNREAAWEIARLLRLRGIGGMILVDFIDMETDADRENLLGEMRLALAEDPVKSAVHDFTALGLMEITRHRVQEPLDAVPPIPCPHCGGTGVLIPADEEDADDA